MSKTKKLVLLCCGMRCEKFTIGTMKENHVHYHWTLFLINLKNKRIYFLSIQKRGLFTKSKGVRKLNTEQKEKNARLFLNSRLKPKWFGSWQYMRVGLNSEGVSIWGLVSPEGKNEKFEGSEVDLQSIIRLKTERESFARSFKK